MEPIIIEGGIFTDDRGSVAYVNDFTFENIERFYIISNSPEKPIRAWQGHKLESKNFYCIQGSFIVSYVKIDDWVNPSKELEVVSIMLHADSSKILHIPPGYANAIKSLEDNSKLMSFSTLPLSRVKEDDIRFPEDMWRISL